VHNDDFELSQLFTAMGALIRQSLGTMIAVFFAISAVGAVIDYYFLDEYWSAFVIILAQFIICYFFVRELARESSLLGESSAGPGFAAYFGLSFVLGIGTTLGYVLLIIPGIILQIRWLLAMPLLFLPEATSSANDCISNSWRMTGKVFWKLLAGWIIGLFFTALSIYPYAFWVMIPGMLSGL